MGNFQNNNCIEYERSGDENKTLSVKEYLDEIKLYLKDIINNLQKSVTWKIQSTAAINFISSKDTDEERVMHSKNGNIEIMSQDKADEVIGAVFELFLSRYQIGLEISMKNSDFIFYYVDLLYYKCHKINFNGGRSYIDCLDWVKRKKATVNFINKNYNKCFQYATAVALNHEEIGKNSQRISKMKPPINKSNWEGISVMYTEEKIA